MLPAVWLPSSLLVPPIGLLQQRVSPRPAAPCVCMQVVAAYERLAAELGGYRKLTLGVNTGKCI